MAAHHNGGLQPRSRSRGHFDTQRPARRWRHGEDWRTDGMICGSTCCLSFWLSGGQGVVVIVVVVAVEQYDKNNYLGMMLREKRREKRKE